MSSFLDPKEGMYNPLKRFAFTNITTEPFTFTWDKIPMTVKPSDTIELPHHLALHATKHLVDKIMIEGIKIEEDVMKKEKNDPYFRHPKGTSLGVPGARKVYEDKILRELAVDEESPQIAIMRMKIKEELMADMKSEPKSAKTIKIAMSEFAEIKK